MDFLATGETADCVSSRGEHIDRSLLSVNSAPPAYAERTPSMETIYEAGEWKWRDVKSTFQYLKELYRYDATTTGVAKGSNYSIFDATSCLVGV
jgi:hypothetical protein